MNLSLSYFGKLPEYPDFIKFNSGNPETAVLDKWIQDGIHTAILKNSNWKNLYNRATPYNFIFPVRETGRLILGVIYFSRDRSGREFPFLVYSVTEGALLKNEYHLLPLFYKENLDLMNLLPAKIINLCASSGGSIPVLTTIEEIRKIYSQGVNVTQEFNDSPAQDLVLSLQADSITDSFINNITFRIMNFISNRKISDTPPFVFWSESGEKENILMIFMERLPANFLKLLDHSSRPEKIL